jgi:hypothetical protein
MPMKKDPAGGGTQADGTRSAKYCSLCYRDGKFIHADFDVAQMQAFCVDQLAAKGMPRFMAWLFTRSIPRLERWRNWAASAPTTSRSSR